MSSTVTESAEAKKAREAQLRILINQKLTESGEREKLKDFLRTKLIECGWREEMKTHCKEVIKQKGADNIKAEDIISEIIPKGRASVPQNVKQELLTKIRKFLTTVNANPST